MSFRHLWNVRGFFSDYYLGSVFARGTGRGRHAGLSDRAAALAYVRFVRIRDRAEGRALDAGTLRERFARPFLRDVLGYHLGAGSDRLHGLFPSADVEAAGASATLLAYVGDWDQDLDAGSGSSQPMRLVEQALARSGLRYGLLLTGERTRLVRAPGDGPKGAYLEIDLQGLAEEEDPESFTAFLRLLSLPSFVPGSDGKIPFDEVEHESRQHAERVSDNLRQAVFSAAESLVGGLIDDAVASGRIAAALDLSEEDVWLYRDAALLGLYRILFVLYAEARDPKLNEHTIYRDSYSAQGLLDDVLREPTRPWPENRCSHWERLRSLFRIYDEGLPSIETWERIPPRGSKFFSTKTPEGKLLDEARLPDSTVVRLMLDLGTTQPRRGVGRERVSFRELDIENLGAVYEGLLEYEPRVARDTTLEVRVQGRTYALHPSEVVRLCRQRQLNLIGDLDLVRGTEAEALQPQAGPEDDAEDEADDLQEDEGNDAADAPEADEEEDKGVPRGGAAHLLRRFEPSAFYFILGAARKGSGSFYTPRPLVQDLVRHAIGPLVKGKTAREIERLRVIDPACGSAHFLVEAMRFLGRALHRAYVEEYDVKGPPFFRSTAGPGWDTDWQASDEDARAANSEARAWCKRRVTERCLFGVDLNPTAVQLARVALWVESVAGDRPLTYFEHHIRCGNSLLGTWMARLEAPPLPTVSRRGKNDNPSDHQARLPFQEPVRQAVLEAARLRRLIDEANPDDLMRDGIEPESVGEQEFKDHLRRKAEETLGAAKLLFDLRSASAFLPDIWSEWDILTSLMENPGDLYAYARSRQWWEAFEAVCDRERFFHWELEFPEVFLKSDRGGFEVILSNPPWDKVLPAKKDFYARHDMLIRAFSGGDLDRRIKELVKVNPALWVQFNEYGARTRRVAEYLRRGGDFPNSQARSGSAHEDLSKYFLDRAARLACDAGLVGMVVPSAVYNGDGWVGLRRFLLEGATIERFYGFENRRKIFPIHSSYKFVNLVFRKGGPQTDGFRASFMRYDPLELEATAECVDPQQSRRPPAFPAWIVALTRGEIQRLSPRTYAFLEYRGPQDQEIVLRMYQGLPTLGARGTTSWRARLVFWRSHEFTYNATVDRDLWTDPASQRLFDPNWVLPRRPHDPNETFALMRERGFWPVFEGKHIEQFVVGIKPIRWWLSVEQAERKYGRRPRSGGTLVYRDTASNTNERTCIAAILPPQSAASYTLTAVVVDGVDSEQALGVLNSLVFDWALRFRTAGTHVSGTYIEPMPVPAPATVGFLPRIATRAVWDTGFQHSTDDSEIWPDLWRLNREVAEAYGLGPTEFMHILGAFPVFARKRPAFYAYLHQRLAEWMEETR